MDIFDFQATVFHWWMKEDTYFALLSYSFLTIILKYQLAFPDRPNIFLK